jgi:4'-phosphopantetheinyl transferase EntD
VINVILPATARYGEAFTDRADQTPFPEEMAMVAKAVGKRRREFVTARGCAREALSGLGIAPGPILAGERGMPQWPPGVVGSITHCAGYRGAAVARSSDLLAIGIDAEPHDALPGGVLNLVSLPDERERLCALAEALPGIAWDRVLFSAKESVYKAWFPLTRRWLGFEEADITIGIGDGTAGTLEARFLVPGPLAGFSGRWLARDGLVLTAVTVPPAAGAG